MKRDRHKRLYDLHSWSGIILGLLIYVVAFTGTVAMFADEIRTWEDPSLRLAMPQQAISIEDEFQSFMSDANAKGELESIFMDFPTAHAPYYYAYGHIHIEGGADYDFTRKWHAVSGEILPERGEGLSHWILDFHRNFMLPRTLGRALVGVVGMALMLSILTGVFIHGKIIKEFFTLRLRRSQRLKWQDSHKVLGLISLPFSTMIAFTGAFLGIIAILAPIIAVIAFKGDQDALINAVLGEPLQPSGNIVQMINVDEIHALRHPQSGAKPYRVILNNYGDANAQFDVLFKADTELTTTEIMPVKGASGEALDAQGLLRPDAPNRVVNAMSPLHYGTFGGAPLKWLYVLLGLSLCALTATGLLLWVERRQYGSEGQRSTRFYQQITKLNTGVCLGFPLATIGIFYLDKLYIGQESARLFWTGWLYFGLVGMTVIYTFCRPASYKTTRQLFVFGGVLILALPVLNAVTTGMPLWQAQAAGEVLARNIDLAFIAIGLAVIIAAAQIPKKRNSPKTVKQAMKTAHT